MVRTIRRSVRLIVLALLGLALLSGSSAGAAPTGGSPALSAAAVASGAIRVAGDGFTPGGRVFVAVYDAWGVAPAVTAWTTASQAAYGPEGSQDPALGYFPGGLIALRLPFAGNCAATMARAYDEMTDTWSAVLDADASGPAGPIFGSDGSQDPARGYRQHC